MGRVFVIGVGMTKFEKPGKLPGDYPDWGKEAILDALKDCRISPQEIELATAGFVYGDSTSGQRVIYEVGMNGIPIFNVNNNCSSGSTALILAKEMVEVAKCQCALAVGFDKMGKGSLGSTFTDRTYPLDRHMKAMSEIAQMNDVPLPLQLFGNVAAEHVKKYGTKLEHLAKIAYKNHKHSVNNPKSQFRKEYTLEQIMKAPTNYGILTKLQGCPYSDGAAAAIVASENFVRQHGLESQAVEIVGMEMVTDLPSTFSDGSYIKIVGYDCTKLAAQRLFSKANIKPTDVQVIELHDSFSVNELITYEALGLCAPGQAGALIDRGDNTYGGKYVVNPSGGMLSRGHPIGATGLAQCAELCWQLRGVAGPRQVPGVKLALQHNIGMGGAVVVALYRLGFPEYQHKHGGIRRVAAAANEEGFTVTPYLKLLQQAMLEDEDKIIEKHRAIYGLTVHKPNGDVGYWVINAKEGKGTIEFNSKLKADVTFIVKDEDVVELLMGKISLQKALLQGKVKIQGNMGLAMRLVELQMSAGRKIDDLRAKYLESKL